MGICLSGKRTMLSWQDNDREEMDFYDLKGLVEELLSDLHISGVQYHPESIPSFHPGKSARIEQEGRTLGFLGEVHPQVLGNYELPDRSLPAALLDVASLIGGVDELYDVSPIYDQPPVLEDLALVVNEEIPAGEVEALVWQTAGNILREVRLFDVYRGEQLGEGKKSLAYSLVYQHPEKTLTDKEVLAIRNKIVSRLEKELGAQLRSW